MATHRYKDKLTKLAKVAKGSAIPRLLRDAAAWIATQERGSLGWFDAIVARSLPRMEDIDAEAATRLRKAGFAFIELGEGSLVSLLTHTKGAPPAVVWVGSEGGYRTLATSLDQFLLAWARGTSGVDDLDPDPDDEDDRDVEDARPAFKAWLKQKGITAPKAKKFDVDAWLEGDKPKPPKEKAANVPPPVSTRVLTAEMKVLPAKLARLAAFLGRRADDAELVAFVVEELKQKPPAATDVRYVHVSAEKAGVALQLAYEVSRDDTPLIAVTSKTFLPYVTYIWIQEPYCEAPFGLTWKTDAAKLASVLGPPLPDPDGEYVIPTWNKTMGDVELQLSVSDRGKQKDRLQLRLELLTAR